MQRKSVLAQFESKGRRVVPSPGADRVHLGTLGHCRRAPGDAAKCAVQSVLYGVQCGVWSVKWVDGGVASAERAGVSGFCRTPVSP